MTSKEALKQLQVYCAANGFALYPSSLPKQTYSIILADGDNGEITTRYPNKRISGYFTPKELFAYVANVKKYFRTSYPFGNYRIYHTPLTREVYAGY